MMQYGTNGYPVYGNYPQPQPYPIQQQIPQIPQVSQQPQAQNNSGLIWVQGEAGAKSYIVAAGCSVLLMDSESQRFFIKSVDESGMPKPLRVFEYTELLPNEPAVPKLGNPEPDATLYATKEELQAQIREMQSKIDRLSERMSRKDDKSNGKPAV